MFCSNITTLSMNVNSAIKLWFEVIQKDSRGLSGSIECKKLYLYDYDFEFSSIKDKTDLFGWNITTFILLLWEQKTKWTDTRLESFVMKLHNYITSYEH